MTRFAPIALLALVLGLAGCSDGGRHTVPAFIVPAQVTIDNQDFQDVDVYLDNDYLGRVPSGFIVSFDAIPGDYDLSLDFIGDGEGPIDYAYVRLYSDEELYVEVRYDFIGAFFDIILD